MKEAYNSFKTLFVDDSFFNLIILKLDVCQTYSLVAFSFPIYNIELGVDSPKVTAKKVKKLNGCEYIMYAATHYIAYP